MSETFKNNEYTTKCSEKTLQSNEEGFFLNFTDNLGEIAGKLWIEKHFGKLKNDNERIKALYTHDPVRNALIDVLKNVRELYRKKSSIIAWKCRQDAEKLIKQKLLQKSLSLFSQSVLRSENTDKNLDVDDGKTLSLALFGRAKLLIEMEKYNYALTDLQLALKENLPEIYKGDAFFLIAICYKSMEDEKKFNISIGLAEKLLKINKDLLMKRCQNMSVKKIKSQDKETPKISGTPNKKFKNACDSVEIKNTEKLGRHVVCKKKINVGDTLVVEPPEGACLIPTTYGTHCQNCFARLTAPIWCPNCSNVAFCNETCQKEAMKTYHKYECKILELLLGAGISVLSHLALRLITQKSLEENLKFYKNKKEEHFFTLCTNNEKRNSKDFFQRTLMAVFLLKCLETVGYFPEKHEGSEVTPNQLIIGEMLLFNLQLLQFNAHEIYEKIHGKHRYKNSKINYIGVGIYPTVALFNHQCYPSVTRHFIGKKIVITSTKTIQKGDLIAENYGPMFNKKPLNVRKNYLTSRYWFNCECPACIENWPIFNEDTSGTTIRIRCPNENCKNIFTLTKPKEQINCKECKKKVNLTPILKKLENCEEKYFQALQKLDEMKNTEGIAILKEALSDFHKIAVPPHKETHIAEETLKAFYADLGNTFEIIN